MTPMTTAQEIQTYRLDIEYVSQRHDDHEDTIARMRQEFMEGLIRRKEQKVINAIGAQLNMDTLSVEFLHSIKHRLSSTLDIQNGNESYYLDDKHLVTFTPPVITMEGNVMTAHQGYGPVGV